jgi:hypothetical protein|nr:MAG TPA: hypothetical protein [Caudoviricetes sp.]
MAVEKDFINNNENAIEYLSGEHYITVSFTDRKMINRVKKLYSERKDDFKYLKENMDGSICAKLPKKWLKLNAGSKEGRVMTDEQKEAVRIRLQQAREKIKKK